MGVEGALCIRLACSGHTGWETGYLGHRRPNIPYPSSLFPVSTQVWPLTCIDQVKKHFTSINIWPAKAADVLFFFFPQAALCCAKQQLPFFAAAGPSAGMQLAY